MPISSLTNYFPSYTSILNKASRGTFKLGAKAVGCYIGSELAGNACLLHVPALLNHYGYQLGASNTITAFLPNWYINNAPEWFLPWAAGQTTLSVSYQSIDAVSRALGGAIGATLSEYIADGTLFLWDLALMGLGCENEIETSSAPQHEASAARAPQNEASAARAPQNEVSSKRSDQANSKFKIVNGRVVPFND